MAHRVEHVPAVAADRADAQPLPHRGARRAARGDGRIALLAVIEPAEVAGPDERLLAAVAKPRRLAIRGRCERPLDPGDRELVGAHCPAQRQP